MTDSTRRSLPQRLLAAFAGPTGPRRTAALAVLLSLPALSFGLMSDDHILALQHELGFGPFQLFHADPAQIEAFRVRGAFAWWASPRLAIHFFRPLASLTHSLDFALIPHAPWLMALQNVLIYGLSCLLAARIYQRVLPSGRVAALAGLLFAIDEAHAVSVGWISGRNTLLSLLFALCALHFRLRAEEEWRARFTLFSSLPVALALLSAEAGTWSVLLLLAHACTLAGGSVSARLTRIAPQLIVAGVWVGVYLALGCGVHGSSLYRELSAPLHTLAEGLQDLPLTFGSLFGPSVASPALLLPERLARLCALPVALLAAWLVAPGLRDSRVSRFFVLCTALCLLPALLAIAQDRVLMGASFGAFGLLAQALDAAFRTEGLRASVRRYALLTMHVVLPLLLFLPGMMSVRRFENGTQQLSRVARAGRDVVLINAPVELLTNYTLSLRSLHSSSEPPPETLHQLYAGGSELWLERPDARTLELTASDGWARVPFERIFGVVAELPQPDDERVLHNLTVRVLESGHDGRPTRVRFTFPTPLESHERSWLRWQGTAPVAFEPPPVGGRLRIAAQSSLAALPM